MAAAHHRRGWLWALSGFDRTGGRPTTSLYGGTRAHRRALCHRWFGYGNAVFDTQLVRLASMQSGLLFRTALRAACRLNQVSHPEFSMGPGVRLPVSERVRPVEGPGIDRSDANYRGCSFDMVLSLDLP